MESSASDNNDSGDIESVNSASLPEAVPVNNVPSSFGTETMFGLPVFINPGTGGIIPVANDAEVDIVSYSEREYVLFFVFRLAKTLRLVAIIQFVFICILAIYSPIFVAILIFPILGYYGALRYSYWPLYIYSVYVVCEIIGCIISFFFLSAPGFYVVRALYLIFCIYVVRFATRLAGYILHMEDSDRQFIYDNPVIVNSEKSLFW